jgi:hypothetical protein
VPLTHACGGSDWRHAWRAVEAIVELRALLTLLLSSSFIKCIGMALLEIEKVTDGFPCADEPDDRVLRRL